MSIDATQWAWKQHVGRSSAKLVLLSMADRADERNECYPSRARLNQDTELDFKTLSSDIAYLIETGKIEDTGRRVGKTNRVRVFKLIGVNNRYNEDDDDMEASEMESIQKRNDSENGTLNQYQHIQELTTESLTPPQPVFAIQAPCLVEGLANASKPAENADLALRCGYECGPDVPKMAVGAVEADHAGNQELPPHESCYNCNDLGVYDAGCHVCGVLPDPFLGDWAGEKRDQVNYAEAERFLALLGDTAHTFQTFDDSGQKRGELVRVLHGSFAQHREELTRLNREGAGIFVTVARTDGQGRKERNITATRALFVDLDGTPLTQVTDFDWCKKTFIPHMTVESSPGRYHAYWLTRNVPLVALKTAQTALARIFKGDPVVKDLSRVMRLPGFFHRKGLPFQSRLLTTCDHDRYEFSRMVGWKIFKVVDNKEENEVKSKPVGNYPVKGVGNGERNRYLFWLGCRMSEEGNDYVAIVAHLSVVNANCSPPLSAKEVQSIAKQALKRGRMKK